MNDPLPFWPTGVCVIYGVIALLVTFPAIHERSDFPRGLAIGILWLPLLSLYFVKAAWRELMEALRS